MIIHDYATTISCDICSAEFTIERNLKIKTMRKYAAKRGWIVIDEDDICPKCAEKRTEKKRIS